MGSRRIVAAATLVLVAFVGTVAGTPAEAAVRPTIAVLGDSFVVGTGGTLNYVTETGDLLGVKTKGFGQGGTGFVRYGSGVPYNKRIVAVLATKPVALVVQASLNDRQYSTGRLLGAAKRLVARVRRIDPGLPIAIVGPIFLREESQPDIIRQRAALKAFCKRHHVTYIDPTGWITDSNKPTMIGPDDVHPTNAGYEHIAKRLARALRPFVRKLGN